MVHIIKKKKNHKLTKYNLENMGMWLLPTPVAKLNKSAPLSETAKALRNTDKLVWHMGEVLSIRKERVFIVKPKTKRKKGKKNC